MDRLLKKDALGSVSVVECARTPRLVRDTRDARAWLRPIARRLARRESEALAAAAGLDGIPPLIGFDGHRLLRAYVPGRPLYEAQPAEPEYFGAALKLLAALHRRGVVHNDLAKEANWLCRPDGRPALIDFQLALVRPRRRGALFRALAREDLRHLLKHKRTYLPHRLTARQRALLARPSPGARLWRMLFKPPYRFVTRTLLGWPERDGPRERRDAPG